MKSRTENDKTLLRINVAVLAGMAAGWLLYIGLSHRLIEAIYGGPWVELLHKALMMEGQSILSVDDYFRGAERIMWSATYAGGLVVASSVLILKSPPNLTRSVLCFLFVLFALSVSAIAFVYPLEIETRESTVWLHVLALRHGTLS